MINQNFLPKFERDQVLSHDHLNGLVTYLEEQDRFTRNKLIGMGVVCGLEVNRSNDRIEIGCGSALTSAGYLVHLAEKRFFRFYTAYKDPSDYPRFRENNLPVPLLELLEVEPVDGRPWRSVDLLPLPQRYCVVLFLELLVKDLDSCLGDHCTNQGRQTGLTWRALLVEKAFLHRLTARQHDLDSEISQQGLDDVLNGKYLLQPMSLARACFQPGEVESLSEVKNRYAEICRAWIDRFSDSENLSLSLQVYGQLLMQQCNLPDPALGKASLLAALAHVRDSVLARVLNGNNLGIQVIYDYLFDLNTAYNEFIDLAFEIASLCCADEDVFPRHVALGCAVPTGSCKPGLCRHHLIPSPLLDCERGKLAQLSHRYQRMVALIQHGNRLDATPSAPEIRITPGGHCCGPLDERAIPFFYPYAQFKNLWQHHQLLRCRHDPPSYHAESPTPAQALRLRRDDQSCLRIEGHQGRRVDVVEAALDDMVVKNNLPINVVTVRLDTWDPNQEDAPCDYEDLRSLYRVARAEWVCLNRELSTFLNKLTPKNPNEDAVIDHGLDVDIQYTIDYTKLEFFAAEDFSTTAPEPADAEPAAAERPLGRDQASPAFIYGADGVPVSSRNLNHISLGSIEMVFPKVSVTDYAELEPHILANRLIGEMIGKMANLITALADDLLVLDYEALEKLDKEVADKIKTLISTLQKIHEESAVALAGTKHLLITRLANWLDACAQRGIGQIVEDYRARGERLQQKDTLAAFIAQNPGLEHKGCVCPGQTFVIVTEKRPVFVSQVPDLSGFEALLARDIRYDESVTMSLLVENLPFTAISQDKLVKALGSGAAVAGRSVNTVSRNPVLQSYYDQVVTRGREEEIVVLDFTLPYLCCGGGCRQVSYVVLPELTLSLARKRFCSDDEATYAFSVEPKGGEVRGDGVSFLDGTWSFIPATASLGPLLFSYHYGNRQAIFQVEVLPVPDANFSWVQLPDSTAVRFESANHPEVRYTWIMPNGDQIEGPFLTHSFEVFDDQPSFLVTLRAERDICSASSEQTIELRLLSTSPRIDIGQYTFCKKDPNAYPITVSPADGELTGPFTTNASGGYEFRPNTVSEGDHTLTYILSDGLSAGVVLSVSNPNSAFEFSFEHRRPRVTFNNKSTGADRYELDFGDGQTVDEFVTEHEYALDEFSYVARLTAFKDNCQDAFEALLNFPQVCLNFNVKDMSILSNTFSADDDAEYLLDLTPSMGGELDGPVVEKQIDGNTFYYFKPSNHRSESEETVHVLLTHWYHGRSSQLEIRVLSGLNANFHENILSEEVEETGGLVRKFLLSADYVPTDPPALHEWEVTGDIEQLSLTGPNPTFSVFGREARVIHVGLTVSRGLDDSATFEKTFNLPAVPRSLDPFPSGSENPFTETLNQLINLAETTTFERLNELSLGLINNVHIAAMEWGQQLADAGQTNQNIQVFLSGESDSQFLKQTLNILTLCPGLLIHPAVRNFPGGSEFVWRYYSLELENLVILLTYRFNDLNDNHAAWKGLLKSVKKQLSSIKTLWQSTLLESLRDRLRHPQLQSRPNTAAWANQLKDILQ